LNPEKKSMKPITNIIYPAFALLVIACLALSSQARADCREGCDLNNFNTFLGELALLNNTTGGYNTATGSYALLGNTNGSRNTATGCFALRFNGSGSYNTATGFNALEVNQNGNNNTATGSYALTSNTVGIDNTANGARALASNNSGYDNTANGSLALNRNTTGSSNTADGVGALDSNTTGYNNTANGVNALSQNNASYNSANGYYALGSNTTGNYNTADGVSALLSNTTGSLNVAIGVNAGRALTTGSGNVCIGVNVYGVAGESSTTRIRNVYSSIASGRAVYVNSDNKIGTLASTRRVKENINLMDTASEAILALKPVSSRYKKEIDASATPQFGLVAEEVADINADLVTRDSEGKPETVRYEAVNAMLLNEFLKEHRKVEQLEKQVAALTAGLQKVSAQLEMSKAAPQTVLNDQ
jgi:hypothetical protein